MFENEILKQGEKIREYRRRILQATQNDVACGVCTKGNISRIEHGKQKLTYELALGISTNFNKIAKEKNIDIGGVTAEKLFESEYVQANRIFKREQKNLEKIKDVDAFEKKLNEMKELIEDYEITVKNKIDFYKTTSHFYLKKCLYKKSNSMCEKGLEASGEGIDKLEEANFYVNKALNYMNLVDYDEALKQINHSEKLNIQLDNNNLCQRILFNKALIYKKKCEYDQAIKYLKILKIKFEIKNENRLLDIKMMYANCMMDENLLNEAKNEYIEILDLAMKINNKVSIALAYRNLAEIHFKQSKYKISAEYIKECLKNDPGNIYLFHSNEALYYAAKIFKKLNRNVETYLLKALEISKKEDKENIDLIEKILYELITIYMDMEEDHKVQNIINEAEKLNIDCNLIYALAIKYYRNRNKEKSVEINMKLINRIKKIKKI